MGTRAAIARFRQKPKFIGVYHNWDGYPSGLGRDLFIIYNKYKGNLQKMLVDIIDKHPAGYSTVDDMISGGEPKCYCHYNGRNGRDIIINESNAAQYGCEYVYVFDNHSSRMTIMSSYNKNNSKMVEVFGIGNPEAKWIEIAKIDLEETQPDWEKIDNFNLK